jgi:uncharacterized protein YecT (DUF1311 family)
MRNRDIAMAACLLSFSALAACADAAKIPDTEDAAAVQAELAKQSGLPESELSALLRDCEANQTSMTFCARRDQVAAEMELDRVVAGKLKQQPECREALDRRLANWRKSRDKGCEKSAAKEYGNGSMKPMAQAMCLKAETERMTASVKRMKGCRL